MKLVISYMLSFEVEINKYLFLMIFIYFLFRTTSFCFVIGATAPSWPVPTHLRSFYIIHNDAQRSVGLLWTSDQLVAETPTCQHTTITTDKHPWPRWDSNPWSQQTSSRRPTPWTARPKGPGFLPHTILKYCKKFWLLVQEIQK
jgi:hypothetical protein